MDWDLSHAHRAVYRLLTDDVLADKFNEDQHIVNDDGIDFEALLACCHSSSERGLAMAAWDLWNGDGKVNFRSLVLSLDEARTDALIDAIRLFKGRPIAQ